jgi:hypothetical protein
MAVVMQSKVNEIWRRFPEKDSDGKVRISFDDLETAVNDVCGIGMDVTELGETPASEASDPDNEETNPFSEEVDDFDKEEASEDIPDTEM